MRDIYYIYLIECLPTGQVYVGMTGAPNPCWRWSRHFTALQRGIHESSLLQEAWKQHPEWSCWQFRVVSQVEGRRLAHHTEAETILKVPEARRLNTAKTSTISLNRRHLVESMLDKNCRYVDIRDAVGISMGTIANIKRARDNFSLSPNGNNPHSTETPSLKK